MIACLARTLLHASCALPAAAHHRRHRARTNAIHTARRSRYKLQELYLEVQVGIVRTTSRRGGRGTALAATCRDLDAEPLQLLVVLLHAARHLPRGATTIHRLRNFEPSAARRVSRTAPGALSTSDSTTHRFFSPFSTPAVMLNGNTLSSLSPLSFSPAVWPSPAPPSTKPPTDPADRP